MLGAIVGDVVGSIYEGGPGRDEGFELFSPESRFTDDSVHCAAVAEVLLEKGDYARALRAWSRRHPGAGYGGLFAVWMNSDEAPAYGSFGNGSAMRVAPVGWALDDLEGVLAEARRSAEVTHDHIEGIRGAQAIAGAVFLARRGGSKYRLREFLEGRFGYDCSESLDSLRRRRHFDVTCQGTVPVAMAVVLHSSGVEDAVRKAVSLGGDADTLGCIAGAVAEALHGGVPRALREPSLARLSPDLRAVVERFVAHYGVPCG